MTLATNIHDRRQDRPWASAEEQLAAIMAAGLGLDRDPRLNAQAINTASPSDGGFAIRGPLYERLTAEPQNELYLLVGIDRRQTGPTLRYEGLVADDASHADGAREGGLEVTLHTEGAQIPDTHPRWRLIAMEGHERVIMVPVTEKALRNSPHVEPALVDAVVREFNFSTARDAWNGTGVGCMLGVRHCPALLTVAIEESQTVANTATSFKKNAAKMLRHARRPGRSVFLLHQDLLADGVEAGAFTDADELAPFGRLATRPVFPNEVSPAVGTVGDFVLADMSDYLIAEQGMRQAVSIHARFDRAEALFRFTKYDNGQPKTSGHVTPFSGTNKKSPFVALAARS